MKQDDVVRQLDIAAGRKVAEQRGMAAANRRSAEDRAGLSSAGRAQASPGEPGYAAGQAAGARSGKIQAGGAARSGGRSAGTQRAEAGAAARRAERTGSGRAAAAAGRTTDSARERSKTPASGISGASAPSGRAGGLGKREAGYSERSGMAGRTAGADRTAGAARISGNGRAAGAGRLSGTERAAGSGGLSGTERTAGSGRLSGTGRTAGADRGAVNRRAPGTDRTGRDGRASGSERTRATGRAGRDESREDRRKSRAAAASLREENLLKAAAVFVMLAIALGSSLFYYKGHKLPKTFPVNSPAIDGIVSEIYRETMGSAGPLTEEGSGTGGLQTQEQDTAGEPAAASYPPAATYEELLSQIGNAIDEGDTQLLQQKITYQDSSGSYQAYSDAQITGFAAYMKANPSDREQFFLDIADAGVYGGETQGNYVVKLPVIYFAITTDTDQTKIVVDTFEAATLNSTDTLSKGPLLPMIYKIYASNESWVKDTQTEVPVSLSDISVDIAIKGKKGSGGESE